MNTISKLSTVGFFAILSLSACGPYEDYPAQETVAKGGTAVTSVNSIGGQTSSASGIATSTGGNVGTMGGTAEATGGNVGTGGTSAGTETSPTVKADAGVNADAAPDVSIAPDSAPTGGCKEGEKTTVKVSSQGRICDVVSECTKGKLVTTLGSCSYVSDASTSSDVLPPAPDSQVLASDTAPVILGLDGGTPDAQAPATDSQPSVDTQPAPDTGSLDTQVSHDAQVSGADALVLADAQAPIDTQTSLNCGTIPNGEATACMTFDSDGANSVNGFKICTNGSFSRCWVPGRVVINCSVTTPTVGLMEVTGDIIDNLKENKDNCPAGLVQDDVKNVYPSGDFNGWIKTVGTAQKYFAGVTTYAFSIPIANKVNRVTFIGETAKGDIWSWNPLLLYEAGSNNKCSWSSANNTMFAP